MLIHFLISSHSALLMRYIMLALPLDQHLKFYHRYEINIHIGCFTPTEILKLKSTMIYYYNF